MTLEQDRNLVEISLVQCSKLNFDVVPTLACACLVIIYTYIKLKIPIYFMYT